MSKYDNDGERLEELRDLTDDYSIHAEAYRIYMYCTVACNLSHDVALKFLERFEQTCTIASFDDLVSDIKKDKEHLDDRELFELFCSFNEQFFVARDETSTDESYLISDKKNFEDILKNCELHLILF